MKKKENKYIALINFIIFLTSLPILFVGLFPINIKTQNNVSDNNSIVVNSIFYDETLPTDEHQLIGHTTFMNNKTIILNNQQTKDFYYSIYEDLNYMICCCKIPPGVSDSLHMIAVILHGSFQSIFFIIYGSLLIYYNFDLYGIFILICFSLSILNVLFILGFVIVYTLYNDYLKTLFFIELTIFILISIINVIYSTSTILINIACVEKIVDCTTLI